MADNAVPSIALATPVAADTVLGVQGGVVKRFPVAPPFGQLAAVTGAGLIGFDDGQVYEENTVGAAILAIAAAGVEELDAGPTITVNISSIVRAKDVTLTGDATLNFSGTDSDGNEVPLGDAALAGIDCKQVLLRIRPDGWIPTLGTGVRYGSDVASIVFTTTPGETDYVGFVYDHAAGVVDVVAYARGY